MSFILGAHSLKIATGLGIKHDKTLRKELFSIKQDEFLFQAVIQ